MHSSPQFGSCSWEVINSVCFSFPSLVSLLNCLPQAQRCSAQLTSSSSAQKSTSARRCANAGAPLWTELFLSQHHGAQQGRVPLQRHRAAIRGRHLVAATQNKAGLLHKPARQPRSLPQAAICRAGALLKALHEGSP